MKYIILSIMASIFTISCGGTRAMTRSEVRECLIDCAVANSVCEYGQNYCDKKRRDCEKECK